MTVPSETEVEIRRLFFAEHWLVGTIATQLNVHEDVVRRVTGLMSPKRHVAGPPRLVEPFEDFIDETLRRYPKLRATRLYDMVSARGYPGLRELKLAPARQPTRSAIRARDSS